MFGTPLELGIWNLEFHHIGLEISQRRNKSSTVKTTLRLLALAILLGAIGWWLAAGANRGWTKNQVPVKTVDEVTGIEGTNFKKQFIPGLDFLAGGAGAAVLCTGLSFLFRTKRPPQTSNEQPIN
jgi:hypothetical protein